MFLWSSAFLQSPYYFSDLSISPLRYIKRVWSNRAKTPQQVEGEGKRKVREQYRAAWGEEITRKNGRPVGWLELVSLFEKLTYPLILLYLFAFHPEAFFITIGVEAVLCMLIILMTAEHGTRFRYAAMIVPATPVRLMGVGVDVIASVSCLADLAGGNRNWRK